VSLRLLARACGCRRDAGATGCRPQARKPNRGAFCGAAARRLQGEAAGLVVGGGVRRAVVRDADTHGSRLPWAAISAHALNEVIDLEGQGNNTTRWCLVKHPQPGRDGFRSWAQRMN